MITSNHLVTLFSQAVGYLRSGKGVLQNAAIVPGHCLNGYQLYCMFFLYSCRWLFLSMLLHIHKYTVVWFNLPKESKWVDLNFFQLYIILIHIIIAFYQNNSKYFDNLISFMTGPNQDKGKKTTESLGKEKVDSKIKTSEMPWSQRRGKVHSNPSLSVSFTNGVP